MERMSNKKNKRRKNKITGTRKIGDNFSLRNCKKYFYENEKNRGLKIQIKNKLRIRKLKKKEKRLN